MKPNDTMMLLAGVGSAAIVSILTGMLITPAAAVEPSMDSSRPAIAELEKQITQLSEEQATLETRLLQAQSNATKRSQVGGVDAAVDRWVTANAPELRSAKSPEAKSSVDIKKLLSSIIKREYGEEGEAEFWKQVAKSDQLDAILEAMEEQAENAPADANVQHALAETYTAKSGQVGMGPARLELVDKANSAYDRTLAIDNNHWDARFGKAIGLSNMPSVMGKAPAAISQFEILVKQQEQRPREDRFAQSYFYLGNLYQEAGKEKKAAAAWSRGLEYFPKNSLLRTQMANVDKDDIR